MAKEDGAWIMYGVDWNDPDCIHTVDELVTYINKVGFLPLFKNEIPGFSVEEHTVPEYWWCGDEELDPWEWREIIAAGGKIAYGKFFGNKAGFISKKWFPVFANYRRSGYDFDDAYEDGLVSVKEKSIMSQFTDDAEIMSNQLKSFAGFGKGGYNNFDGCLSSLQMHMYLCVRDFQQRTNKKGDKYGWPLAVYSKPEHLWGYDHIAREYNLSPEDSHQKILKHMKKLYDADAEDLKKII